MNFGSHQGKNSNASDQEQGNDPDAATEKGYIENEIVDFMPPKTNSTTSMPT